MKSLIYASVLIFISMIANTSMANNVVYVPQEVVPQPVLQVMVYQAPAYTVMVPVVVQPQPVIEQRVIWGYPYQVMTVPVDQYRYWGYDRRCLLINRY